MRTRALIAALALAACMAAPVAAQEGLTPITQQVTQDVRDCRPGTDQAMPIIAWGADGVTIDANGLALETGDGPLREAGWSLDLAVKDDFVGQVRDYVTCASPFLRGTLGMLVAAAPVTQADPRTEQVVFFKHSWSAGDGIVAGEGIARVADLKGKRVAIQAYGPHVDFVGRILADGGLSFSDVEVVWTADLTGDGDTPLKAMRDGRADAAAMILPDARALTSGGTVGTGAEGSVRGARILFSTQEATAVIADYIAVRRDYFDANRDAVAKLVNALFRSEEAVRAYMAKEGDPKREQLAAFMADKLLGGLPPEEGVFLWADAVTDGWAGNAKHFADAKDPRRFEVLEAEVVAALKGAGVIDRPYDLATADWDYTALTDGLSNLDERQITRFDPEAAAAAVEKLRRTGQLDANTKIDFRVYFEPDSTSFPPALYAKDFEELVRLAATYSGAIITVEGHADPLHYLKREKAGANNAELRAIRTSAKNLSLNRAVAVVDALSSFAKDSGVALNRDQFTVDGVGIDQPVNNPPRSENEWKENMRVVFRLLTTQAEATAFAPL